MADILTAAGYASGDYDVTALSTTSIEGYVLAGPMTARSAIEPLQVLRAFRSDRNRGAVESRAAPWQRLM